MDQSAAIDMGATKWDHADWVRGEVTATDTHSQSEAFHVETPSNKATGAENGHLRNPVTTGPPSGIFKRVGRILRARLSDPIPLLPSTRARVMMETTNTVHQGDQVSRLSPATDRRPMAPVQKPQERKDAVGAIAARNYNPEQKGETVPSHLFFHTNKAVQKGTTPFTPGHTYTADELAAPPLVPPSALPPSARRRKVTFALPEGHDRVTHDRPSRSHRAAVRQGGKNPLGCASRRKNYSQTHGTPAPVRNVDLPVWCHSP